MTITFQVPELQKRLGQLVAVIARTSQEALYVSVRIFSNAAGVVFLQGADVDSTLTLKLPTAVADGQANVLLEYSRLNNIVQKMNTPTALLTLTGETEAILTSGRSRARLACLPTSPFTNLSVVSSIPSDEELALGGGIKFPLPGLKEQIAQVYFTVPKQHSKYVAAAALLAASDNTLRIAGTDGKMLGLSAVNTEVSFPPMTIPKQALDLLNKLDGGAGNIVTIFDTENLLTFSTDGELLTYGKSHAEFPPYERIIPKTGSHTLAITLKDKTAFIKALEQIRPSCFGDLKSIVFSVTGTNELTITAVKIDKQATGDVFTDMADEVVDAEIVGTPVKFQLDIDRILPYANAAVFPMSLYVKDSSSPVDVHANSGTPDKQTYRFVLMPMRLEGGASSVPLPLPASK
jgi:DNA polymerase III sliding clamp (beta) subunit (PCNA family)